MHSRSPAASSRDGEPPASLSLEVNAAFSFVPRANVVAAVRDELGETLCGAEAPPCLAS